MSIEQSFFGEYFFQQVELAEKINLALWQGKVAEGRGFTPLKIVKTSLMYRKKF